MVDPDATLCSPGDPAQAVRLAWLREAGLVDEDADAGLLEDPAGVDTLIDRLHGESKLSDTARDSLLAINAESELYGPYATIKELGRGAMGVVYHARRIEDGHEVALKVIKGAYAHDFQFRKRFENECKLLEQIEHESICSAVDWDLLKERPWLAMRYVPGIPLNNYLVKHGALPEAVSLRIIKRIAEGLSAVEQRIGIVHRDIKPGNIIIQPNNADEYPNHDADIPAVLIDFGLAKDVDTDGGLTMAGSHMGTPAYMATEQIDNPSKVDLRADIFGLGATLFHMLTGRMPFTGSSAMDILNERVNAPQPDPRAIVASIGESTRAVVLTAMADNREDRFLSHIAMARAISKALENQTSGVSQRFLRKPLTTTQARENPGTGAFKRTTTSVHRKPSGEYRRQQSSATAKAAPKVPGGDSGARRIGSATTRMQGPENQLSPPSSTPGTDSAKRQTTGSGSSAFQSGPPSTAVTSRGTSGFGRRGGPGSGSTDYRKKASSGSGPTMPAVDPFADVPDGSSSREGPGSAALRNLLKGRTTEIKRNRERELQQAKEAVGLDIAERKGGWVIPVILILIGLGAIVAAAWKLFG